MGSPQPLARYLTIRTGTDQATLDALEGKIGPDRLRELRNGAGPTPGEINILEALLEVSRDEIAETAPVGDPDERAAFFDQAQRFTPLVAVEADDATFLVSTADRGIGRSLFRSRSRPEMRLLRAALAVLEALEQPVKGILLDVGANIGTVGIAAACSNAVTEVVAFEPHPANALLLRVNALLNGVQDRVRIHTVAVGDVDGEVALLVRRGRSGGHEVELEESPRRESRLVWDSSMRVPSVSLDTLIARGAFDAESVGLIWMDVQGHEGHVLRAATRLTEGGVPVVLELSPKLLGIHRGLDSLAQVIGRSYTHVVPLRRVRGLRKGRPQFELIPVERFRSVIDAVDDRGERSHTDVLLVDERARARQPVSAS